MTQPYGLALVRACVPFHIHTHLLGILLYAGLVVNVPALCNLPDHRRVVEGSISVHAVLLVGTVGAAAASVGRTLVDRQQAGDDLVRAPQARLTVADALVPRADHPARAVGPLSDVDKVARPCRRLLHRSLKLGTRRVGRVEFGCGEFAQHLALCSRTGSGFL